MERADLTTYVPDFNIFIENKPQADLRKSAISISVNEKVGGDPSQFTLVVGDIFDAPKQKFVWLEEFLSPQSPLYNKNKLIEIHMGYQGKLTKIISATLESISTSGFSSNITTLTLVGNDASRKQLVDQSTGSAKDDIKIQKDDTYSKIAEKLADQAGLKKQIDQTKKYRPVTIKKNVTYIDYLKDAAKLIGFEFFITRDTLYFIDPRKERKVGNSDKQKTLTLKWHVNLQEFNPTINIANLVPKVQVRGNLPNSNKSIVKEATAGQEDLVEGAGGSGVQTGSQIAERVGNKKLIITNRNFNTEEEASDIAKATLNITSDKLITASCSIVGNPDLTPGQYIRIEGVGKQLSGKYYVTDVTHTIDGSGFTTKFNVSRNNIVL
jgi:uncharacterized protein